MEENIVTDSENQIKKPLKFSVLRVIGGVFLVLILLYIIFDVYLILYSSGAYLKLIVNFRKTSQDITLHDSGYETSKAKELFSKNEIKIDETKEIIVNYSTKILHSEPGQQNVTICLKYFNLPIYSRCEHILFDKDGKFKQELDSLSYSNAVQSGFDSVGNQIPEKFNNVGLRIVSDRYFEQGQNANYAGTIDTYFASIKENLIPSEPKISYQQALEQAMKNSKFASRKSNGYTAQLGLIENSPNNSDRFDGKLVWKIMTNDKQIFYGLFASNLSDYHVLVDASNGKFICNDGINNIYSDDCV